MLDDVTESLLVAALILAVAVLYSAAGQAGGSGYIAVMALARLNPEAIRPTALLLNRQNLPFLNRPSADDIDKGGYVLSDAPGARAIIIATGSEVQLALGAQKLLAEAGTPVRVVSMPSTSVFDRQSEPYRNSVLPREVPKVAVEAGVSDYWRKYVGLEGAVIGIDRFGESAPAGELFKHFGFTPENVANAVRRVLGEKQ